MTRLHVALVLAAAIATGAVATSSQATPPGTNGRIVFERLRFQNKLWGELFVMNPDGSGVRKITHLPNGSEDGNPDWSPDGSRIVFARAPASGAHSIWTVKADGTGPRRLTPACPPGAGIPRCHADDGWPTWSPDGKHIALQRLSGALRPKGATVNDAKAIYKDELVITDANGRHARTLVWLGPWKGDPQIPSWSPDGKRLVSWSPDGDTILFRTHPGEDQNAASGYGANLYTIHPNGTGLHQLTHLPSYDRVDMGSYSPNGRSILFETSNGAVGGELPDIFVMNADGTNMRPITRTRNFETGADWGPSG